MLCVIMCLLVSVRSMTSIHALHPGAGSYLSTSFFKIFRALGAVADLVAGLSGMYCGLPAVYILAFTGHLSLAIIPVGILSALMPRTNCCTLLFISSNCCAFQCDPSGLRFTDQHLITPSFVPMKCSLCSLLFSFGFEAVNGHVED